MKVEELVEILDLKPHPEGGYYKETYRSETVIPQSALINGFGGDRSVSTAIYFLMDAGNFSAFHKIKSDELWHFYAGDALEVVEIDDSGNLKKTLIGNNLKSGEIFQYAVKANTWFASRVKAGGKYSLVGCTVAPGFDFADFEMAKREDLIQKFPQHKRIIEELTRG